MIFLHSCRNRLQTANKLHPSLQNHYNTKTLNQAIFECIPLYYQHAEPPAQPVRIAQQIQGEPGCAAAHQTEAHAALK